jgi:kynureninase
MERATAASMDQADPLAAFRDRFPIPADGPIYLDGNSLGRPSYAVQQALTGGFDDWYRHLVGGWSRWIDLPGEVGDRLGALLGAGPGQVLVCDSTTVNLYKLADAALTYQEPRDVIVGDANDFPTDRYVLTGLAEARQCELRLLTTDPVTGLDLDNLAAALDGRVALVCLSHVNYRSAARLDLAAITGLAHDHGALVLWDLSHSAGAVPVQLDGAGADFAVGCTYKYLNAGPGAPGFLYVRRDLAGQLRQPIPGWFGQRAQFEMGPVYQPAPGVGRFLTGTPPVLGLLAVRAGVDLLLEAGPDRLWAKAQALTGLLVELALDRLVPAGPTLASPPDPDRRGGHVSIADSRAWQWCAALIERGLVVPDFRTPDVMRLGPVPLYTRFVDVYDAVERIRDVISSEPAGRLDHTGGSSPRPRVT